MKEKPLDYATASAGALARGLAVRQISAVELCDVAIAAIEARDGAINAVVVRDFDRARDTAKAADAALAKGENGALLGVPMTVKESHNVPGLPTTWGLEPFRDWIPKTEAIGVARLKTAGAVILGKTNVPPSLGDWQAANPIYGRTNNPHDLGRSPGGSSGGGAAALAAGMIPLEYGSDNGGSIRVPAHFCGVFGHKPTFGLIPSDGHSPPPSETSGAAIQFAVVGPLARTAGDLELALRVLAGPAGDAASAYRLDLPPPRGAELADFQVLMLDAHPLAGVDDEVAGPLHALAHQLGRQGAKVSHGSSLVPDLAASQVIYLSMMGTLLARGRPEARPQLGSFGYLDALDAVVRAQKQWSELFQIFDVVLTPPFGTAAFPHTDEADFLERRLFINGEASPYGAQIAWGAIATFPGLPATCAPIAKTKSGLPIGVQIIGPRFEDRTPIAFAGLIEREFGIQ